MYFQFHNNLKIHLIRITSIMNNNDQLKFFQTIIRFKNFPFV